MHFCSVSTAMLSRTLEVQIALTELDLCVENINVYHCEDSETCLCAMSIDADRFKILIKQNIESIHDHDLVFEVFEVDEAMKMTQMMQTESIESLKKFMHVQAQF